jgi:hypothetical protein
MSGRTSRSVGIARRISIASPLSFAELVIKATGAGS